MKKHALKSSTWGKCLSCDAPTCYIYYEPNGSEYYQCVNCLGTIRKLKKFRKMLGFTPSKTKQTILEIDSSIKKVGNSITGGEHG